MAKKSKSKKWFFIGQGGLNRALSIILVVAVLGALGALGYLAGAPNVGEKFSEFYILGLDGEASDYPSRLAVGEEGRVVLGIYNREHETVTYRVEVNIDGISNNRIAEITIANEQRWEEVMAFTPERVGDKQKVEFLLFKSEQIQSYRELYLWLDVR